MARKAPRKDVGSKNERVLHTRIPAALEDDIKKVADRLRIPVSNLVRNILQDALALATSVQKNVGDRVDEIRDLAGDNNHYAATVISNSFKGKSRVQQHQMVYAALKGQMGGVLHALALQTGTPEG